MTSINSFGKNRLPKTTLKKHTPSIFFVNNQQFTKIIIDSTDKDIVTTVDILPEYPGGLSAMYKYLSNNLTYPKVAQMGNIEGKVLARFVVKTNGVISDVEIQKGIGFGCNEEVIRLLKSMPRWTPGYINGKPVNVYFNIPIVFSLGKKRLFRKN